MCVSLHSFIHPSTHPEAIRIPTVSFSETESNTTALLEFDRLLRKGKAAAQVNVLVLHGAVRKLPIRGLKHPQTCGIAVAG